MPSFRHSGKLGDLVYSLPAMRELGGGTFYIRTQGPGQLSEALARSMLLLLETQPYIEVAELWRGEPIDYDLDNFRSTPNLSSTNLAIAHMTPFGLDSAAISDRWLYVDSIPHGRPVLARSMDHFGWDGLWTVCLSNFENPLFVGTEEEHCRFCSLFGEVEWWPTDDVLQLAQVIAGCSVFVGNQSCPYAIAEGLKVSAILELDPRAPNCIFNRADLVQVTSAHSCAFILDQLDNTGCDHVRSVQEIIAIFRKGNLLEYNPGP